MKITVTSSQKFSPIDAGPYHSVCVGVVDLGTQSTTFGDKRQVVITWELVTADPVLVDGKLRPRHISKTFTSSLHEKAGLRKFVESCSGKTLAPNEVFELRDLLGKNCMVIVSQKEKDGKTFNRVEGVTPLPKKFSPVISESEHFCFDFEEDGDPKVLPEWLQKKIEAAKEWRNFEKKGSGMAEREPGGDDQ
jgi:hypothetical protein